MVRLRSMTKDTTAAHVGDALRKLREAQGIKSQEKLAELVGLHWQTVGAHERGETAMSILDAIKYADALDATLDALVGRKRDKLFAFVRSEPVYVIDPQAMADIKAAKTLRDLSHLLPPEEFVWGATIKTSDLTIDEASFKKLKQQLEAIVALLRQGKRRPQPP